MAGNDVIGKEKLIEQMKTVNLEKMYLESRTELFDAIANLDHYNEDFEKIYRKELKHIPWQIEIDDLDELYEDAYGANEYDYRTKTEAKQACKSAMDSAIQDIVDNIEINIESASQEFKKGLKDAEYVIDGYYDALSIEYEALFDILGAYSDKKIFEELFKMVNNEYKAITKGIYSEENLRNMQKKLGKLSHSVSSYTKYFEFDDDGDSWCFSIQSALDNLYEEASLILNSYSEMLENVDFETYVYDAVEKMQNLTDEYIEIIKEHIHYYDMVKEKGIFATIRNNLEEIRKGAGLLFKDAVYEGTKEGYCIAAAKYDAAFEDVKKEFNRIKRILTKIKKTNDAETDKMLGRLEGMETGESMVEPKEIEAMRKRKDELIKKNNIKVKEFAKEYSIPADELFELIEAERGANKSVFFSIMSSGLIGGIFTLKNKHYSEGIQFGFEEASELFEEKIDKMKTKMKELVDESQGILKEYALILSEIFDEIVKSSVSITTLEVAEGTINDSI